MDMTREKSKPTDPAPIGQVLGGVLQTLKRDFDHELVEIWNVWDRAVGPVIAANARPAAYKGRLLLVHAASSSWMQQLHFLKHDIREKLNQAMGKPLVEEIVFKIGSWSR